MWGSGCKGSMQQVRWASPEQEMKWTAAEQHWALETQER